MCDIDDLNHSGLLGKNEFTYLLKDLDFDIRNRRMVERLFSHLDKSKDGKLAITEIATWWNTNEKAVEELEDAADEFESTTDETLSIGARHRLERAVRVAQNTTPPIENPLVDRSVKLLKESAKGKPVLIDPLSLDDLDAEDDLLVHLPLNPPTAFHRNRSYLPSGHPATLRLFTHRQADMILLLLLPPFLSFPSRPT